MSHSTRPVANNADVPIALPPLPPPYTIMQGKTTPFPCNPCNTLILMRVAFPCIFRHPNWHSMVLRRPRMSTTCQVHEQRRVPVRFYRSNQPWGRGGPHVSQSRLMSITNHQTTSLFVPSPTLTYLKPLSHFFFSFLGILGNKLFPPNVSHWQCWA